MLGLNCQADVAARADQKVVIVGAGVAGMACAIELKQRGIPFTVSPRSCLLLLPPRLLLPFLPLPPSSRPS